MPTELILLGVFVVLLIAGGITFLLMLKKSNTKTVIASQGTVSAPSSTQAFLPFKDIVDSMIVMDNHEYRMIVDCNSINFFLKTEAEQDAVEMQFRRFLNSIKFPFSFYIQTREIDNREIVENLRKNVNVVMKSFPQLREYAGTYIQDLQSINEKLHNSKFKKKFIVVTYDEAGRMTHLNDVEKKDYAFEELYNRCKIVTNGLANIGIKSRILNTNEVANVVYQSMHKEVGGMADDVMDGSYLSLVVHGKTYKPETPLATIDSIIIEFENKLNTEIITDRYIEERYKIIAGQLVNGAEKMRDNAGGYFRSNKEGDFNEKK